MAEIIKACDRFSKLGQALWIHSPHEGRIAELLHYPIEYRRRRDELRHADRQLQHIGASLDQLVGQLIEHKHLELEIGWHEISYRARHPQLLG